MSSDEVQRSLGRVEGLLESILKKMEDFEKNLGDHKNDDQKVFSSIRLQLNELALANAGLQGQDDNIRTIGKYILGIFGGLAMLLGSAIVAALTGHIRIT